MKYWIFIIILILLNGGCSNRGIDESTAKQKTTNPESAQQKIDEFTSSFDANGGAIVILDI